jgi:hypothetical protein
VPRLMMRRNADKTWHRLDFRWSRLDTAWKFLLGSFAAVPQSQRRGPLLDPRRSGPDWGPAPQYNGFPFAEHENKPSDL